MVKLLPVSFVVRPVAQCIRPYDEVPRGAYRIGDALKRLTSTRGRDRTRPKFETSYRPSRPGTGRHSSRSAICFVHPFPRAVIDATLFRLIGSKAAMEEAQEELAVAKQAHAEESKAP